VAHDQLSIERAAGRAFTGFEEGPLSFPPTYKLDRGSDAYDTSEKQRVPSWTDRILFKPAGQPSAIELLHYRSDQSVRSSDHRPVTASFRMSLRVARRRRSSASSVGSSARPRSTAPSPLARVPASALGPVAQRALLDGMVAASQTTAQPVTSPARLAPSVDPVGQIDASAKTATSTVHLPTGTPVHVISKLEPVSAIASKGRTGGSWLSGKRTTRVVPFEEQSDTSGTARTGESAGESSKSIRANSSTNTSWSSCSLM
jgi:hypothetical protein